MTISATTLIDKPSRNERYVRYFLKKWVQRFRKLRVVRLLAFLLIVAAISSGIVTYITITQSSNPLGPDPEVVMGLILMDLIFILALAVIISKRLVHLWLERRRGSVGSRLQTRIVLLFSLVSVMPTIIVAVFSSLFFNYGIQSWFNGRVSTAIEESVAVAESYLEEHKKLIRADILAMAKDIGHSSHLLRSNPKIFNQVVSGLASYGSLAEVTVFTRDRIIAKSHMSFSLAMEMPSYELLQRADIGEVVVIEGGRGEQVKALVKLDNFLDTYLMVGRFIDSKILSHIASTQGASSDYNRLHQEIAQLQIYFSIVFVVVALLLMLAAIWLGMIFALDLTRPISQLISATGRVKTGELSVRVKEGPKNDEIGTLSRAFNRMTEQLEYQHSELLSVNEKLEDRRHFIETVLRGVSAGVIALSQEKHITVFNRSALTLLVAKPEEIQYQAFEKLLPEMVPLLTQAEKNVDQYIHDQITITRGQRKFILLVQIVAETVNAQIEGYIITFDDISELVLAQRSAAWADVARRVAHEIKNPLTPIALAAERLRRKYADYISEDKENYIKYTETIMQHVTNIEHIVEEFASFARMPKPTLKLHDIRNIIESAVFSRQDIDSQITYHVDLPDTPVNIRCDKGQITQVLSNLLKNAEESILVRRRTVTDMQDSIDVAVTCDNKNCVVSVRDNGMGFPEELLDNLTKPYVTTSSKGSGLGLAIVKKIIEDHNGGIRLVPLEQGAEILFTIPLYSGLDET